MGISWVDGSNLIGSDNVQAELILLNCESQYKDNPIDLHFTYNSLIKLYYKESDKKQDALDKCVNYCLKDIALFPKFQKAYIAEYTHRGVTPMIPRIPSFQQLAIIYEKQRKYKQALQICKRALEFGLHDNTKDGFEGRIKKLEKKISQQ
ncbi:hypothetical protein [Cytobacillus oceanisediminis]|uniref:hypothetical protein n=1 Tax=Cytobacillus oceanisediminis TaxID=665099 RepID=UPI001C21C6A4|nr:hypothetical protein [Cytobacillus oceanisediminis]MBU8768274.1 hypothetical protein [Cytobacillus oceanisediminis]